MGPRSWFQQRTVASRKLFCVAISSFAVRIETLGRIKTFEDFLVLKYVIGLKRLRNFRGKHLEIDFILKIIKLHRKTLCK